MPKQYWYNGPDGWFQGSWRYYGKGYDYSQTPMGKSEANIASLKSEYEKAYNEAKTANETRYGQILGGYDTLQNDTMAGLDGMGTQARRDVNTSYDKAYSNSLQGLINSGMANSTILPSVSNVNATQRSDATGRLNETLRREKLGYMNDITNNKLSFMERRTDSYPDVGLYTSLMNNQGNYMANVKYGVNPTLLQNYNYYKSRGL
jgi:hypothetical protein